MQTSPAPIQFLTVEEAQAIDRAKLSSMDKFMTRITVSAMRVLIKIAESFQVSVEALSTEAIISWLEKDSQIRKEQGESAAFLQWSSPMPDLDFVDTRQDEVTDASLSSHEKFLARMIIAAKPTMLAIAESAQTSIQELTIGQVIDWMERKTD